MQQIYITKQMPGNRTLPSLFHSSPNLSSISCFDFIYLFLLILRLLVCGCLWALASSSFNHFFLASLKSPCSMGSRWFKRLVRVLVFFVFVFLRKFLWWSSAVLLSKLCALTHSEEHHANDLLTYGCERGCAAACMLRWHGNWLNLTHGSLNSWKSDLSGQLFGRSVHL